MVISSAARPLSSPPDQKSKPARAHLVLVMRKVSILVEDSVREFNEGDLLLLPEDEAAAWCECGWARPVKGHESESGVTVMPGGKTARGRGRPRKA
jgi:hypothetical protein